MSTKQVNTIPEKKNWKFANIFKKKVPNSLSNVSSGKSSAPEDGSNPCDEDQSKKSSKGIKEKNILNIIAVLIAFGVIITAVIYFNLWVLAPILCIATILTVWGLSSKA